MALTSLRSGATASAGGLLGHEASLGVPRPRQSCSRLQPCLGREPEDPVSPRCMALFPQRLGFGHFWPKQVFSLVAFSPLPTTCCSENGWGPPFRSGSWVREDVEATESRSSFTLSVHSWGSRSREGYVSILVPGSPRWGTFVPATPASSGGPASSEPQEEGGARHQDALC